MMRFTARTSPLVDPRRAATAVPGSRRLPNAEHGAGGRRASGHDHEAGFTFVEVLVAALVLMIGLMGTLTMIDGANARSGDTRLREGGTALIRELTEASRAIPYPQLTPQSIEAELQAQPGLADSGAAPGWQITRRGVPYTVTVSVCSMDDPADGGGAHDTASFCSGSATGTTDRKPDDYKAVTIDVTWARPPSHGNAREQALITNPGNSVGPAINTLSLTGMANNVITSVVANASFGLTTSVAPQTVAWSIDGAVQGSATGAGTTWNFVWPITNLVDGTYLVEARAYDANGVTGGPRTLTVSLNRFIPLAPTGLAAGRSGTVVDLEWIANTERDVVGYRVKRVQGLGTTTVCDFVTQPACQDPSPPNAASLVYTVTALDRDNNGNLREGLPSVAANVNLLNTRPGPPGVVTANANGDGSTTLTWTAAHDPDLGDSVAFYRVYRDGSAFENRYDRTGDGITLSLVDGRSDGTTHTYWVSAVDTQLAESVLLGPVTG